METGFSMLRLLPSCENARFRQILKRQGKNYLNSLERAYVLAFSVEQVFSLFVLVVLHSLLQVCGPDMNFLLLAECAHYKLNTASEPNWTIADDAALLQGAYHYGQVWGRLFSFLSSS
jgi:hypothetical protein